MTVGKPEVVINGESRPLDVPPMVYQGVVVVPVRVISEGMGAYVQWVPDRVWSSYGIFRRRRRRSRLRRRRAGSAGCAAAAPADAAATRGEAFVAGDYIISPKVYNEFSPGNTGTASYAIRGGGEFSLGNVPFMLEGSYERYQYPHNCNTTAVAPPAGSECYVTTIGGVGSYVLPTTSLNDQDVDARFAVRVLQPRIYIGVGYMWMSSSYGYPNMNSWGFGAEKLPDLNQALSFFGSVWYYPDAHGTYTNNSTADH